MTNRIIAIIAVLGVILGGFSSFTIISKVLSEKAIEQSLSLGAIGTLPIENYIPAIRYNDGLYTQKDFTTTGDATVSGGTLTVTTSNSATSTIIVGCTQGYATSTATPWRYGIVTVGTSTAMAGGGTANGFVVAQYGSCPR